jgi:hypothetical protein
MAYVYNNSIALIFSEKSENLKPYTHLFHSNTLVYFCCFNP